MKVNDFERHYDGRRFHVRKMMESYQVYGVELRHICFCDTDETATMVATALEEWACVLDDKEADHG